MKQLSSKKMVIMALFIALTCVATMTIQIPSPMSGYVNLGDCLVLLGAWILGPLSGGASAAIGSALADLLTGYTHYALGTFVIKGAMAWVAGCFFYHARHKNNKASALPAQIFGGLLAEVIMVLGYFAYAGLLLGNGLAAASSIPGNVIQGIFGILSAVLLMQLLEKSKALSFLSN